MRPLKITALFLFGSFVTFGGPAQALFADIDVTHPYFHSIDALQSEGIVEGHKVGETVMFFPLSVINRAEALKLILLSSNTAAELGSGEIFSDVEAVQWFSTYVNTAYQLGVVEGFPDGTFRPANKVLRAEFVKMLFETLEVPVPDPTAGEAWYEPYMVIAEEYRLLPASKDGGEGLSRGEAAEIIYRTQQVAAGDFTRKYVYSGAGMASYYNEGFAGRSTASGEPYNPEDLTAAHRTLPFGTRIKVSNREGAFVVVKINDRGPYHETRVLDLSEAAFERLAPVGTGVLWVDFELFSDPEDEIKTIPEAIRPLLSEQTLQTDIPLEVQTQLREDPETIGSGEATSLNTIPDKSVMYDQPIFREAGSSISTDFFPNLTLRAPVMQKVPQGFVFELEGIAQEAGHKEVTVFLQNQASGEQTHFSAPVSGKNFIVPVSFFEMGTFDLGIVFDKDRESRVAEIEVASYPRERKFPSSDVAFASNLLASVTPENEIATLSWATGENRLTKLVFSQGENRFNVVLEDGMNHFDFEYDWFDAHFDLNKTLAIDLYQAVSEDGTLFRQRSNWKKVTFKNFKLVRGFPDDESEAVSVQNFQRFYRSPQTIAFSGNRLTDEYELYDSVFITKPDGMVSTEALWQNGDQFSFSVAAQTPGRYIVEVISTAGDILFNRAIYVEAEEILPVMANKQVVVKENSTAAIYDWINRIRYNHEVDEILSSANLQQVAQQYAERMADEGFLGHVAPDGSDPASRLEHLDLRSFAENVSYGSNLNLALSGLENSGSHRRNILSDRWSRMGVGMAQNQKGEFYVVQIFAS